MLTFSNSWSTYGRTKTLWYCRHCQALYCVLGILLQELFFSFFSNNKNVHKMMRFPLKCNIFCNKKVFCPVVSRFNPILLENVRQKYRVIINVHTVFIAFNVSCHIVVGQKHTLILKMSARPYRPNTLLNSQAKLS